MENRKLLIWIFISGALAVAIGAFGAHGLRPYMDDAGYASFQTGNRYHFYHTLLALGLLVWNHNKINLVKWAVRCSLIGNVLFAGSLYCLSVRSSIHIAPIVGPITPVGGLFYLASWLIGIILAINWLKN